jgi:hypothetical protein
MSLPSKGGYRKRLILSTAVSILLAVLGASNSFADPAAAGRAQFMRSADSTFDAFTKSPATAQQAWMKAHYWRMRAYSPYFDSRLAWSPKAWVYLNAYAIYVGGAVARDHPDWILRDAAGNKLYIPFGCKNGTCPQYAGDIGNPAFRTWWTSQARARLALGYSGIYVDDVNLYRRVGNGAGQAVDPIDPRTHTVLSEAVWQRYMADHMAAVRAAFPTTEIVHNVIWYAGETTSDQLRQLRSADFINLERGVNDAGLTGGTGKFSLQRLLAFADHRHAEGHGVVFEGRATTDAGRLYNLAAYLLVSSGHDGIGNASGGTPTDWWGGYDVDLGAPLGARYLANGVIRRDFERGVALVNEPGAPTRTVTLPAGARDVTGTARTRVTLPAASGAVFSTAAPPAVTASATFTVPKTATAAASVTARTSAAVAAPAAAARTAGPVLTLRVAVLPGARAATPRVRHVRISGRLSPGRHGRVDIVLRRARGGSPRHLRERARGGRFVRTLRRVRPGKYRVAVTYRAGRAAALESVVRRFSVPR